MTDRDVVAAKLAELSDRMRRIRSHCPTSAASLTTDRDACDLVAFNVMLAVQSCLDLASHIIADEGWPPPATLAEAFVRLQEHGVVSHDVAEALGRAAAFRNVVAHGYGRILVELLHDAATVGLLDLQRFAEEVSAWIGGSDA